MIKFIKKFFEQEKKYNRSPGWDDPVLLTSVSQGKPTNFFYESGEEILEGDRVMVWIKPNPNSILNGREPIPFLAATDGHNKNTVLLVGHFGGESALFLKEGDTKLQSIERLLDYIGPNFYIAINKV